MKKEALIVHLSGGLGNQLFQISTGISLGQITSRSLIINKNLYKNPLIRGRINSNYQKKRKFEANNFKSVASISLDWKFRKISLKIRQFSEKTTRYCHRREFFRRGLEKCSRS